MTLMSVVPHFYLSVHIKDIFKINKFFVFFFATRPTEVNSSQHSKIRKFFIELAIKCAIGTRLFPSRLIILGPHIGTVNDGQSCSSHTFLPIPCHNASGLLLKKFIVHAVIGT